ncbi:SulP family inorganic anion transporter [Methylacidimicrobium sp. B4]|uniref:SulP family inorganic anion transporter n=1 Tax=Methylacidimicrobium sp. B4 TaxID=2796139 RepID=UPI001A8CC26D|nr:SulP family inorganic anion transporter [Methylacidimicrobium sp. B4]QSR85241.1 SulP family inorganic anion transporter [Methylacidimicrobium sp. B4]
MEPHKENRLGDDARRLFLKRIWPASARLARRLRDQWNELHLELGPLRATFRSYSGAKLRADLSAALNVALLSFPQGMAYALIAGLPIQFGIYACAVSSVIGPLFQSSRYVVLGPTNATAVLVFSSYLSMEGKIDKLHSLSFLLLLIGLALLAGAIFRAAALTQYVSRTVVIGYITGAALLIIANQVHHILGVSIPEASTFFDILNQTIRHAGQAQWPSVALSLLSFLAWWWLKTAFPKLPAVAIALLVVSLLTLPLRSLHLPIRYLDPIPFGFWPVSLPSFHWDWFSQLASASLALAFFAAIEGASIGKSLASRSGEPIDPNREMFAQGAANVACAFLGGMPVSGSLTRSALNWISRPATVLANFWSGLLLAAGLLLAGPFFAYIPMPALATLVVLTGFSLINWRDIRIAVETTTADALAFLVTFLSALLTPLDFAIGLGIGVSLLLFLKQVGQPSLIEYTYDEQEGLREKGRAEERILPEICIIHVEGELFFGVADLFREQIRRICFDPSLRVVILRMRNAHHLDATCALAIDELAKMMHESGRHLLISGATRPIIRVLRSSGVIDTIGRENVFPLFGVHPNLSTRNALLRAQQLLGKKESEVRIFFEKIHAKPKGGERQTESEG